MTETQALTIVKDLLEDASGSYLFTDAELLAAWLSRPYIEERIQQWEQQITDLINGRLSLNDSAALKGITAKKKRAEALLKEFKTHHKHEVIFNFRHVMLRKYRDWTDHSLYYIDPLGYEIDRAARVKMEWGDQTSELWSLTISITRTTAGYKFTDTLALGNAFTMAQAQHGACRWVAENVIVEPVWRPGTAPIIKPNLDKFSPSAVGAKNKADTPTVKNLSAVTSPATVPSMPSPERKHFIKN